MRSYLRVAANVVERISAIKISGAVTFAITVAVNAVADEVAVGGEANFASGLKVFDSVSFNVMNYTTFTMETVFVFDIRFYDTSLLYRDTLYDDLDKLLEYIVKKPSSPDPQPRNGYDLQNRTPKKQKQCNCKYSRCLKLYCECFASGIYCDGCNCINCENNIENEAGRKCAIEAILERNSNAFKPKIANSTCGPQEVREEAEEVSIMGKHNKGCNCKKSECLKKYCECFQANIFCSDNCKCMDCKNFEGIEERKGLLHGDHGDLAPIQQPVNAASTGAIGSSGCGTSLSFRKRKNDETSGSSTNGDLAHIQQAVNAAITRAIGSSGCGTSPSFKKRENAELFSGSLKNGSSNDDISKSLQANFLRASAAWVSSQPTTASPIGSAVMLGSSEFTDKSPLGDALHPGNIKRLCSLLVVVSSEALNAHADHVDEPDRQTEMGEVKSPCGSSTVEQENCEKEQKSHQEAPCEDHLSGNISDVIQACSPGSDTGDMQIKELVSPGTFALMSDEEDTVLMEAGHPKDDADCRKDMQCKSSGQGNKECHAKLEGLVLTGFLDFLNRLVTSGSVKGTKCSQPAKDQAGEQNESSENIAIKPNREATSHNLPVNNSTVHPFTSLTIEISNTLAAEFPVSITNAVAQKVGFCVENGIYQGKPCVLQKVCPQFAVEENLLA
ncbi:CRC domain [Dillenia turbinata]|uniref:CRC domain n=1 Tax=Dillenia turbinata TaxID=194707 RepID=A0AAN8UJ54_9MAGN